MYIDIGDTDIIDVNEKALDNMYDCFNDINKTLKTN